MNSTTTTAQQPPEIGFVWWSIWGWLCLVVGDLALFAMAVSPEYSTGFALVLLVLNTTLMGLVIAFNKTAFLIATAITLNPLMWIINGIYLKNRWHHPKVNSQTHEVASASQTASVNTTGSLGSGMKTPLAAATQPGFAPLAKFEAPVNLTSTEEEDIYERASNEIGSESMKKGLWAKCTAEADGNDPVAKARYIKVRGEQMLAERRLELQGEIEARDRAEEQARHLRLQEQQAKEEAEPKGTCPNCGATVRMSVKECPSCQANFSAGSAWKPSPLAKGSGAV